MRGLRSHELLNVAHEGLEVRAARLTELATDQVHGLDVVRAFVDAEDLRVAAVLLDRVVARVARAAVGLDGGLADAETLIRAVGLHERNEEVDLALVVRGLGVVHALVERDLILVVRELDGERTETFDLALHVEKHAANVGVLDDGHARRRGVFPVRHAGALLAIFRVFEGVQIRRRGHREALHADRDARGVHHHEHLRHALVDLCLAADGDTDAGVVVPEREHACGGAVDAHLVLERRHLDVVLFAEAAALVVTNARHDEEREALGSGGRAVDAGKHEVDHVLGEVVVTARDVDLRALDAVGAVVVALGGGLRRAHVASGVGLREAHGAAPFAAEHALHIELLLLGRAEVRDHLGRAVRKTGVHVEGRVRAAHQLFENDLHTEGRSGSAELGGDAHGLPPRGEELVPGVLEALRRDDSAVLELAALDVADHVERSEDLADEAVAFRNGRANFFLAPGFEGSLAQKLVQLELLEEQEIHVTEVGLVAVDGLNGLRHGGSLKAGTKEPSPRRARRRRGKRASLTRASCDGRWQWPSGSWESLPH